MYMFCLYVAGTHNQFELTPILSVGIFIGVLTALMCIALGTVAAIKLRTAQHRRQQNHQHHQQHHQQNAKGKPNSNNISRPGNLPIKEKISLPLSQSEEMYDEKNPDVVPYNEGNFINFFYRTIIHTHTYAGYIHLLKPDKLYFSYTHTQIQR